MSKMTNGDVSKKERLVSVEQIWDYQYLILLIRHTLVAISINSGNSFSYKKNMTGAMSRESEGILSC